jgi:hypothetical protein
MKLPTRLMAARDIGRLVWLAQPLPLMPGGRCRVLGYDPAMALPDWIRDAITDRARECST